MKDHSEKTFLLTALVVLVLLLLHFLPPITIGETTLRQVNLLSDLTDSPGSDAQAGIIPLAKVPKKNAEPANDGIFHPYANIVWPKGVEPIEDYAAGVAGGMDHFYYMLDSLVNKKPIGRPVRIAYYGDSFIEGDILTEYLREMMQTEYGGYGVGWLDAGNDLNQYKQTIVTQSTGLRELMVMKKDGYNAQKAGIAERYYPGEGNVSMTFHSRNVPSTDKTAAGKGKQEFPHLQKWQSARTYLIAQTPVSLTMNVSGGHQTARQVAASDQVQVVEMTQWMNNITIGKSGGNAVFYGVALETDDGVVVDNFSMRGSSGITLSSLSTKMLSAFNSIRPYDLIIFQFGTNAINASSGQKSLEWYMEQMKKVIVLFRKSFPETSILVMSTPDRGARTAQGLGTMKNIEALVSYQQQLAADNKVGFYNLFNAMGGVGSMAKLCEQGMGSKDFVHINHQAGKLIAKHIFDSFRSAVNHGRKQMAKKQNQD